MSYSCLFAIDDKARSNFRSIQKPEHNDSLQTLIKFASYRIRITNKK